MSAVLTLRQRYLNALNFYNLPNKFVVLGGQDSWIDESQPGVATGYELSVPTPIIFKEVDMIQFAKIDEDGELLYSGVKYTLTTDLEIAKTENYTYMYVQADVYKDHAPVGDEFRVVGLYVNTDATVDENGYSYPIGSDGVPNVVSNEGDLAVIDLRSPVTRHSDQIERISIMIEF